MRIHIVRISMGSWELVGSQSNL